MQLISSGFVTKIFSINNAQKLREHAHRCYFRLSIITLCSLYTNLKKVIDLYFKKKVQTPQILIHN